MSAGEFHPVVKWTGSKRLVADEIASLFPSEYDTYYEPFIGGGALLYAENPSEAIAGDKCEPLVNIWRLVRDDPEELAAYYRQAWTRLQDDGEDAYYEIRDGFNDDRDPRKLFFLTRTCVNGLIRFNDHGEFNASLHLSRPGVRPNRLARTLDAWSRRLAGVTFRVGDYEDTLSETSPDDLVFLDPPYFNTKTLYYGGFESERFIDVLQQLNQRGVRYALTLDGASGNTDYTVELPDWAFEERRMVETGTSPYKRVVGDGPESGVKQSLYLNYKPPAADQANISDF